MVYVLVIDDEKPTFAGGSGQNITSGILASTFYDSKVIQIRTIDKDLSSDNSYRLSAIQFVHLNRETEEVKSAFTVDGASGVISTRLVDYFEYVDGHFTMTVEVLDAQRKLADSATLVIFIVRSNQRIRFIFDRSVESMANSNPPIAPLFISIMDKLMTSVDLYGDDLHYHIEKDADVNFKRADLCFHVIKDFHVILPDVALNLVREAKSQPSVTSVYEKYDVIGVEFCEVKVTTRWWSDGQSDYWYLWWLLIALALFIFIVTCIAICCLVCCKRYREKPYNRYIRKVGDSDDFDGINQLVLNTEPSNFEWQEETVDVGNKFD